MFKKIIKRVFLSFLLGILLLGFFQDTFADGQNNLDFDFKIHHDNGVHPMLKIQESGNDIILNDKGNNIYIALQNFIVGIGGIVFIVLLVILIKVIVNIAINANNPNKKAEAVSSMVRIIIAIAATGSITTVLYFGFNFLAS